MRHLAIVLGLSLGIFVASESQAAAPSVAYPDIHVEVTEVKVRKTRTTVTKVSDANINMSVNPTLSVGIGTAPIRYVPLKSQDLRSFTRLIEKLKKQTPQNEALCKRNFVRLTFEDGKPRSFCLEAKTTAGMHARNFVRRLDLALKVRAKTKPRKPLKNKKSR
ncbi:MAG: hypothetical protein EOP05_07615 [Proteobacteria bacterium]|nr:MAG: hypothetical protein EOP05_07615 [Pseudomonadota bacterium]